MTLRAKVKLGMLLGDLWHALLHRPVTQPYPRVRRAAPARLRGRLYWNPQACSGCALCTKDCPAQALELLTLDKAAKRFVLRYHLDRCTFCGQCVQSCRFNCLSMASDEWELAATSVAPFTIHYGEPADVESVLAAADAANPHARG